MREATTLESRSSPKRIATSTFSAIRSRNVLVMKRSTRMRGCAFRKRGEEFQKRLLTQRDRHRDAQQSFGLLLRLREHALGFLQQAERLLALIEVFASLRRQAHAARGAAEQCRAELRFQHRQAAAHGRDRHPERARRAADALVLRHLHEDHDVVQVRHGATLPSMEIRLQSFPSNQARAAPREFAPHATIADQEIHVTTRTQRPSS